MESQRICYYNWFTIDENDIHNIKNNNVFHLFIPREHVYILINKLNEKYDNKFDIIKTNISYIFLNFKYINNSLYISFREIDIESFLEELNDIDYQNIMELNNIILDINKLSLNEIAENYMDIFIDRYFEYFMNSTNKDEEFKKLINPKEKLNNYINTVQNILMHNDNLLSNFVQFLNIYFNKNDNILELSIGILFPILLSKISNEI